MTQTTIVEGNVGGDDEYVAGATALTTALSMIFIPLSEQKRAQRQASCSASSMSSPSYKRWLSTT